MSQEHTSSGTAHIHTSCVINWLKNNSPPLLSRIHVATDGEQSGNCHIKWIWVRLYEFYVTCTETFLIEYPQLPVFTHTSEMPSSQIHCKYKVVSRNRPNENIPCFVQAIIKFEIICGD